MTERLKYLLWWCFVFAARLVDLYCRRDMKRRIAWPSYRYKTILRLRKG